MEKTALVRTTAGEAESPVTREGSASRLGRGQQRPVVPLVRSALESLGLLLHTRSAQRRATGTLRALRRGLSRRGGREAVARAQRIPALLPAPVPRQPAHRLSSPTPAASSGAHPRTLTHLHPAVPPRAPRRCPLALSTKWNSAWTPAVSASGLLGHKAVNAAGTEARVIRSPCASSTTQPGGRQTVPGFSDMSRKTQRGEGSECHQALWKQGHLGACSVRPGLFISQALVTQQRCELHPTQNRLHSHLVTLGSW